MLARFFLVLAILLSVTPAVAGPDSDAVRKFSLVGTWAIDCSKLPSTNNVYLEYTAPSTGYPIRSYYSRRGQEVFSEMRNVRLITPNRIAYLGVQKSDGDLVKVVIELADGRLRHYESSNAKDGEVYIKDGKVVPSGTPAGFYMKCSGR
jgi:hypothetical protein